MSDTMGVWRKSILCTYKLSNKYRKYLNEFWIYLELKLNIKIFHLKKVQIFSYTP